MAIGTGSFHSANRSPTAALRLTSLIVVLALTLPPPILANHPVGDTQSGGPRGEGSTVPEWGMAGGEAGSRPGGVKATVPDDQRPSDPSTEESAVTSASVAGGCPDDFDRTTPDGLGLGPHGQWQIAPTEFHAPGNTYTDGDFAVRDLSVDYSSYNDTWDYIALPWQLTPDGEEVLLRFHAVGLHTDPPSFVSTLSGWMAFAYQVPSTSFLPSGVKAFMGFDQGTSLSSSRPDPNRLYLWSELQTQSGTTPGYEWGEGSASGLLNGPMMMRLRVTDRSIQVRAWPEADSEPSTWTAFTSVSEPIATTQLPRYFMWNFFNNNVDATVRIDYWDPCGGANSTPQPPTSCDQESLSSVLPPASDGRVSVVYDPLFLLDPTASSDYLADAERIAHHVQERAEAALDHYDVLLGSTESNSHTSPNVTIEIRCQPRLEVLGEIPVFHIDRPGFTGDWDDVQLRSDDIQAAFASAVADPRDADGDFLPDSWDSPPARWASDVDHEIFHTVQHWGQSDMGLDYLLGPDAGNLEAAATLAQDLFADADDDGMPEAGSYWRAVRSYFENPVPVTVEVASDEDAYTSAPVLQYLGEQYGGFEADYEQRVANFLRRMIASDRIRIDQLQSAMLSDFSTVDEAIRDFATAAYVNDKPSWANYAARYQIADEAHNHAGIGSGTDYPAFQGVTGPGPSDDNDLTFGGSVSLDEPIGEGEARIFEIDIAPNVLLARLSLTAWNATERTGAAVAILPVKPDGSVEVSPAYFPYWLVRAEYQEPITVPVAGLSKLAVVVGSTARVGGGSGEPVYQLSASDMSSNPSVQIVPPSDEPRSIGSGPDFNPLQVLVRPLSNGNQIRGLSAAAFDVEIGGLAAEIRSVVRVAPDGSYALLVQPPATLGVGAHDLEVTLANLTSDTAAGAIIVDDSAGLSAQSSSTGLTGFLHVETIGEVDTPIQVRYVIADRAGPIAGAMGDLGCGHLTAILGGHLTR